MRRIFECYHLLHAIKISVQRNFHEKWRIENEAGWSVPVFFVLVLWAGMK